MKLTVVYRLHARGQAYGSNIEDMGGGGPEDVEADTREEAIAIATPLIMHRWECAENDFYIVEVVETSKIRDRGMVLD